MSLNGVEQPKVCRHGKPIGSDCGNCDLSPDAWLDCFDDPPDWKDVNRRAVLKYADGREVEGTLKAEGFFTGEDEVPVPRLVLDDGTELAFYDAEQWRLAHNTGDRQI